MTQANSSRFLESLPLTLRRPIYDLLLISSKPIEIHPKARRASVKSRSEEQPQPVLGRPAILQTCKQIREEATPIHYEKNIFVIPWGFPNLGCTWLDSLTIAQRRSLRDVRFCYGDGAFWTVYDARIALSSLKTALAKSGSLLDLTEAKLWVPVCEFSVHTWTELADRNDAHNNNQINVSSIYPQVKKTSKMKAAQFYDKHDIRIEDVPEPIPDEGQVTVDVEWCGICGSDLHEYLAGPITVPTKSNPAPNGIHIPVTLGHELCGRVRNPPPTSPFLDGDPVMIDPRILCHACAACTSGCPAACYNLGYVGGSTGFGGFGEKVIIRETSLRKLPPEISLEDAAVIEPLAIVQHAVKVSGIRSWEEKEILVITIPCWKFLHKHITMKGTLIFGDDDMEEVMEMMVNGKLKGYEKMITGRIALDDIVEKGFKELINNKDEHIKILVQPRSPRDSVFAG
ncbi:hypothetical protein AC578_308 [Pseudocercospora eumusae]|uniref:4Fe-4S ferredoxin-type domain-containing protein n=1 Tax=Pseudocercospora eumusae TaxID=321146 RepID=A0A139HUA2_9PEZI|nr:hypothetical protein AC578_308 [Pseudocercospora eumusae]